MRKYPARRLLPGGVALLLLAGLLACSSKSSRSQIAVDVKAGQAGTYQLGNLTVSVPAHAVPRNARLTMTAPTVADQKSAPLGAKSVQFDLSFDGNIEPVKPLDVTVKLRGDMMPAGVNPNQALLYTQVLRDGSRQLVPTTVQNGVLRARLYRLSPKIITYPTDQDLLDTLGIRPASVNPHSTCQTSVKTAAGEVQFIGYNRGWSHDKGSPINACLLSDGNSAKLTVTNRLNYLMAVAATGGLRLTTNGNGHDEEVTVNLAQKLFPDKRIQTYVGRGADLSAPLLSSVLPATVQLKADPSSFLAEAAWNSVKFIVGLVAGVRGDKLTELADNAVGIPEVLDCLGSTLKFVTTPSPSFNDVIGQVTNKCTDVVTKNLGNYVLFPYEKNAWGKLWSRVFVVVGGVGTAWSTMVTALTGITMQFVGILSVSVGIKGLQAPSPPSRKLPEPCGSVSATYSSASVTVAAGGVTCATALQVTKLFLNSDIGSSGSNVIGIWNCGLANQGSTGSCESSQGRFSFVIQ